MPQGISVHVGVNNVDPGHYAGWSGDLRACESDANDMERIAQSRGFQTKKLLTAEATTANVSGAIRDAASRLSAGDLFVVTYSGHGGQVADTNGDEPDQLDETWVLYDRQLVDDELYALWAQFPAGVRILLFSDSCHSGSVQRDIHEAAKPLVVERNLVDTAEPREKDLPYRQAKRVYLENKSLYDGIQAANPSAEKAEVAATLILLSGCQDNQLSLDGDRNGLFTQHVLETWHDGSWSGSHPAFHKAVGATMPPTQSPNYNTAGARDPAFEQQTPLTI